MVDVIKQISKRITELREIYVQAQGQHEQARSTMDACNGAIGELSALLDKAKAAEPPAKPADAG